MSRGGERLPATTLTVRLSARVIAAVQAEAQHRAPMSLDRFVGMVLDDFCTAAEARRRAGACDHCLCRDRSGGVARCCQCSQFSGVA